MHMSHQSGQLTCVCVLCVLLCVPLVASSCQVSCESRDFIETRNVRSTIAFTPVEAIHTHAGQRSARARGRTYRSRHSSRTSCGAR